MDFGERDLAGQVLGIFVSHNGIKAIETHRVDMEKMDNASVLLSLMQLSEGTYKEALTSKIRNGSPLYLFLVSGSNIQVPAADLWEEQAPTDTNAIPGNLNLSFSYVK